MALSNSERQARYRQRLKEQAQGVTPQMIEEAGKIFYRVVMEHNLETPDWSRFLERARKKRGSDLWPENLPVETDPDFYDWIEDEKERALLIRVAPVIRAVLFPPAS